MVLEGTCQKKLQGSVGELFADHLWEIFPEIFVREILGTFVPQCFLKMLSGMPPRSFKTNAVFWVISPKICSCLWARRLPRGCWKQIITPRVFNERFAKQIPPEEWVDAILPHSFLKTTFQNANKKVETYSAEISPQG